MGTLRVRQMADTNEDGSRRPSLFSALAINDYIGDEQRSDPHIEKNPSLSSGLWREKLGQLRALRCQHHESTRADQSLTLQLFADMATLWHSQRQDLLKEHQEMNNSLHRILQQVQSYIGHETAGKSVLEQIEKTLEQLLTNDQGDHHRFAKVVMERNTWKERHQHLRLSEFHHIHRIRVLEEQLEHERFVRCQLENERFHHQTRAHWQALDELTHEMTLHQNYYRMLQSDGAINPTMRAQPFKQKQKDIDRVIRSKALRLEQFINQQRSTSYEECVQSSQRLTLDLEYELKQDLSHLGLELIKLPSGLQ